jgi:tRNA dimethylallyltransferase
MITILGPTASGKTALAVQLAYRLNGEVISADSRQVYCGMSVGTGKDLSEYSVNGKPVPYHLIDIAEPGYEYNLFEYQQDFHKAYDDILSRGKLPVLCGGSGMYLESVLRGYRMKKVNPDPDLENSLAKKSDEALKQLLLSLKTQHNTTDLTDRNRMIRAILISQTPEEETATARNTAPVASKVFGIQTDRLTLRDRITQRLKARLEQGMIEEVQALRDRGLSPEQIRFYGLEYRFIMLYLEYELNYDEMFARLNTAIHQFAKRQMTWFRKMEKSGISIHWINGKASLEDKIRQVEQALPKKIL